MKESFEDYQVEQLEQAAYQGAMLEAGKEWERQREEFDMREAGWQARAEKAEAENATLREKLAEYEVGYDPVTNPPADMEKVFFVDEDGVFYAGGFDSEGKFWWQTVVITPTHISGHLGKIPQESVVRWFPLPGSRKE